VVRANTEAAAYRKSAEDERKDRIDNTEKMFNGLKVPCTLISLVHRQLCPLSGHLSEH